MFNSPWIRKPNFSGIKKIDYNEYWKFRGFEIAKNLKPREKIILDLIPGGSKIIDMGCGNSLLPIKLKEKRNSVFVADISSLVLDQYKKFEIEGMLVDLENPKSINLKEKFDYIILTEVLEHTKNPEEIINELKKYTKFFVITVPNSASYQFRFGLMFKGRFFTQWVHHPSEHLRFWSHIDFLDWLSAMNLNVKKVIVSDGFSFRGLLSWLPNIWKNFLGFRMIYLCEVK
jgi:methionine biosynthesis protein MetW